MMQKKGASHADWAISLGIFLIYILSLFLIIQPGVEPIYREDTLLGIVEGAFMGGINTSITRSMFTINATTAQMDHFVGKKLFLVYSAAGLPFDFNDKDHYNLNSSHDKSLTSNFGETDGLYFKSTAINNGSHYRFWIDYSQDYTYDHIAEKYDGSLDDCISNRVGPFSPCTLRGGSAKNFTFTLGTTEVLKGLSESKIAELRTQCLSTSERAADRIRFKGIKESWNFPANKEFSIYYVKSSSPKYGINETIPICNITVPSNQTSVFAKETATWLLDADGNRQPVRVNIKVW